MLKKLCSLWVMLVMALSPVTLSEAAPIPLRGVVEGFYGEPWQTEERLDMLKFCGQQGLNAYIYAPKNDVYHKEKWREEYPAWQLQILGELAAAARENGVEFIYAISPGADLRVDGLEAAQDRAQMEAKLLTLYEAGIKRFAIFFDDIAGMTEKSRVTAIDGQGQAKFINEVQQSLRKKHPDIGHFLTVPTEYFYADMVKDGRTKEYTHAFAWSLSPDVTVLYTGAGVVPEGVTAEELKAVERIYQRPLGLWWNYPVNDYMEGKLALGPIVNLPSEGNIPAIFFNPMRQEEMSKIALATGAEYAKNPQTYDPEIAWYRTIKEQYWKLAPDMELFASHSQRMENSWAHMGRADGVKIRRLMDEFWAAKQAGESREAEKALRQGLNNLALAQEHLRAGLKRKALRECKAQLNLFRDLIDANQEALDLMVSPPGEQEKLRAALAKKADKFSRREKIATLSEKTLRSFIDEVLRYQVTGRP